MRTFREPPSPLWAFRVVRTDRARLQRRLAARFRLLVTRTAGQVARANLNSGPSTEAQRVGPPGALQRAGAPRKGVVETPAAPIRRASCRQFGAALELTALAALRARRRVSSAYVFHHYCDRFEPRGNDRVVAISPSSALVFDAAAVAAFPVPRIRAICLPGRDSRATPP
ncbi:hypothetical protein MRX96_035946 [Rhipicephalus microplus]